MEMFAKTFYYKKKAFEKAFNLFECKKLPNDLLIYKSFKYINTLFLFDYITKHCFEDFLQGFAIGSKVLSKAFLK